MAERSIHLATISHDRPAYQAMRRSLAAAGYTDARCRFTLYDNTDGNRHEPYAVLRQLAGDGDEPYVVLCHHDLRFGPGTTLDDLLARLAELDRDHPRWAVAGTAGGDAHGRVWFHLDDPTLGRSRVDALPRPVVSLDENFLAFARGRFPAPSPGLSGFHWYGTDVCLAAAVTGHSAHLIDFPVTHLSPGSPTSPAFEQARQAMIRAWRPRLLVGVVRSTCDEFRVSRLRPLEWLLSRDAGQRWVRRRGWAVTRWPFRLRHPL